MYTKTMNPKDGSFQKKTALTIMERQKKPQINITKYQNKNLIPIIIMLANSSFKML